MSKMTVEDTSLTAVADAIRTKGGTTDPLVFPDGFVDAIGNISGGVNEAWKGIIEGKNNNITADMLEGITEFRSYLFFFSGLESIVIPDGIKLNIGVFSNCMRLVSVVLPDSLTTISGEMFNTDRSLPSIVIPRNVTKIVGYSFNQCAALTTVEMKPTTPPTLNNKAFNNCTKLSKFIVPKGSLDAYKTATNWSAYADLMVEAEE